MTSEPQCSAIRVRDMEMFLGISHDLSGKEGGDYKVFYDMER